MNKFFSIGMGFLVFFTFQSCQKALKTGDDLLPDDDNISIIFNDTTTLVSSTVRANPIRTDRLILNHLGCMDDPDFGQTYASSAFELGLPIVGLPNGLPFDEMDQLIIDSVVLRIEISDFYGDSTQPQYYNVHQLSVLEEKLLAYYSDDVPMVNMSPVGSIGPHFPSLSKKINSDSTSSNPRLSFKLDNAIGELLLKNLADTSSYSDFAKLLPGFALAPDSNMACGGGLYILNFLAVNSSLRVHYSTLNNDSLVVFFPTSNTAYSRAWYAHKYQNTDVGMAISDGIEDEEISYVQGLAGVQTKIEFPFLKGYAGSAINKAEVEISQVLNSESDFYEIPDRLFLTTRDNRGLIRNITDFSFGNSYYGGYRDSVVTDNQEKIYRYVINISAFLQETIDKFPDKTPTLYLTTIPEQRYDGGQANPTIILPEGRVILGGAKSNVDNSKMKLNLKYTNIE